MFQVFYYKMRHMLENPMIYYNLGDVQLDNVFSFVVL